MSLIVKTHYEYWNDGRCYGGGLMEYESVRDAIQDLGMIAWHNAIDETITIEQTIPAGHATEIFDGINKYVAKRRHELTLSKARDALKSYQDFLNEVDDKIAHASKRVIELEAEIEELEKKDVSV